MLGWPSWGKKKNKLIKWCFWLCWNAWKPFCFLSNQILQSDGGNYSVCVNAATLAVIDAGIPMRDYVCACTVGFVDETPLADLCYAEESGGVSSLALALLPRGGQIALLQMDARLHQDHLEALIEAAMTACKGVSKVLDEVVRQHLQEVSVLSREWGREERGTSRLVLVGDWKVLLDFMKLSDVKVLFFLMFSWQLYFCTVYMWWS